MGYKKLRAPGWLIAVVAVHSIWTAVTDDVRGSVAAAPSLVADNQSDVPLATTTLSESAQQCRLTSISRACNVLDQPICAFGRSPKIETYDGMGCWRSEDMIGKLLWNVWQLLVQYLFACLDVFGSWCFENAAVLVQVAMSMTLINRCIRFLLARSAGTRAVTFWGLFIQNIAFHFACCLVSTWSR